MPLPAASPADLFRALARVFRERRTGWYVFGAQAVLVWGRPRFTADVDVTVHVLPEDQGHLVEALGSEGFVLRDGADEATVRRTRVLPFMHAPSGWPLDIVLAGPGLEERFLAAAVEVDLGGDVRVPVLRPEDLIVTKILAGRAKDIEDVRGVLLERLDTLDLGVIRDTLALLEEALGVSDLQPVLEAEVAKARGSR